MVNDRDLTSSPNPGIMVYKESSPNGRRLQVSACPESS